MKNVRHIIFGELVILLTTAQFMQWEAGTWMSYGFPLPIAWRRWNYDGTLSTWQFEHKLFLFDLFFIPVFLIVAWLMLYRSKKVEFNWHRHATAANMMVFSVLLALNIWHIPFHMPDFSSYGNVWVYGMGWPFPSSIVPHFPPDPNGTVYCIQDLCWFAIFNPLVALMASVMIAVLVNKIIGQNKNAELRDSH